MNQPLPDKGGELPSELFRLRRTDRADDGMPFPELFNIGHTFPLLTHNANGVWRLCGTGFYITSSGLFVTAAHNLTEEGILDGDEQVAPMAIWQMYSEPRAFAPLEAVMRPIAQAWIGDAADVALGQAMKMARRDIRKALSHPCLSLSWSEPSVGEAVVTHAFPNHSIEPKDRTPQVAQFRPDVYNGRITQVGDFRDRAGVPYPYFETTMRIHGAASGGPVFGSSGGVIGVNARYLEPDGPGWVAQIRCLQDAFVEERPALHEGDDPTLVSFAELVAKGTVTATGFTPNAVPRQAGRIVHLNKVLFNAKAPDLSIDIPG